MKKGKQLNKEQLLFLIDKYQNEIDNYEFDKIDELMFGRDSQLIKDLMPGYDPGSYGSYLPAQRYAQRELIQAIVDEEGLSTIISNMLSENPDQEYKHPFFQVSVKNNLNITEKILPTNLLYGMRFYNNLAITAEEIRSGCLENSNMAGYNIIVKDGCKWVGGNAFRVMDLGVLRLPNSLEYLGEQRILMSGFNREIVYDGNSSEFVELAENSNWNRYSLDYNVICKDKILKKRKSILDQVG